MREKIILGALCAIIALLAIGWRPAGDKAPRPEFAGGPMAETEETAWTQDGR